MGLPIWRDPEEATTTKDALKTDPTAAARSSIRRRPSVHGRHATRPSLTRESSNRPVRVARERALTAVQQLQNEQRRRFEETLRPTRSEHAGVPPVSTLLESADRSSTIPPPAPGSDARTLELQSWDARERELRRDIARLQYQAQLLEREERYLSGGNASMDDLEEIMGADYPGRRTRDSRTDDYVMHSPSPRVDDEATSSTIARPSRSRRSPPPVAAQYRPRSRDGPANHSSALPTPPHDTSEDSESLFIPEPSLTTGQPTGRPSHPLSNSWRPGSPINGLGDRNRSPTPGDGWEVMRTTITPDASLPSAESSFASAVASNSFTSSRTSFAEPENLSSSDGSNRTSADGNQSDSVSSVDPDDLACNDEEREATAAFAADMYYHERNHREGLERINRHREAHEAEGNLFLLDGEPECVEIGFRLISEALDTPEGRQRMFQLSQTRPGSDAREFEDWLFSNRSGRRRTRGTDPEARDSQTAARDARMQLEDYLRRYDRDMLRTDSSSRTRSPPPSYEPLASHPDVNSFTSREPPAAHPVSPPNARSERDVADALLSGDEQDLDAMRDVVERLAQRDDVPEEWWMSMGLNLSRTRAGSRSRAAPPSAGEARVRTGRVERNGGISRL